jgi:hypothetical protein
MKPGTVQFLDTLVDQFRVYFFLIQCLWWVGPRISLANSSTAMKPGTVQFLDTLIDQFRVYFFLIQCLWWVGSILV